MDIILFTCAAYTPRFPLAIINDSTATKQNYQQQKSKSKNTSTHIISTRVVSDTTFTLKIENDKRVVDDALKAKLIRELKAVIAKHQLKKPYKVAMGFTKGAREVETFLFGEQIFYTMAESGFTITGIPLDIPDETPNAIPQVKVINHTIYIILSKL
ncbi:hypothetical protein D0T08_12605 [Emticicia sp. C21]|nr:hypothetical protein D0T08_12605 [Emticicia sp. C21]